MKKKTVLNIPSPNKNVNGILSLFPEAEIIASETNGPMAADVLPITENREKKRNI